MHITILMLLIESDERIELNGGYRSVV